MKRAGLPVGGWGRTAGASAALLLGLALSPIGGSFQFSATAAAAPIHAAANAAAATPAVPQLATYAGVPASGKPTDVAQQPFGLAVSGRYTFLADPINHSVRLLVDNNEIVFAGNGSLAAEGDGSVLARTQLVGPYAVAVGHVTTNGPFQVTAFDVYIADTFANEIRKVSVSVNPVGGPTAFQNTQVCTLAGSGTANFAPDKDTTTLSQATFRSPYGLAWDDHSSTLYIADTGNNRIRKIFDPPVPAAATPTPTPAPPSTQTCATGTGASISTVIGGSASLPATGQLALNHPRGLAFSDGRLFIADTYNNAVRVYDPVAQTLTSFAGTGTAGFSGDGQTAGKATMQQPAGVAGDGQGNLFIADTGNNVIREVGTDGIIRTVAGTAQQAGNSGDGGPAILAKLSSPMAVAVRPNGDVVIGDSGNNEVRILEANLASGPVHNIHLEAGNGTASFAGDGQRPAAAEFAAPTAVLSQLDPTPVNAAVPAVTGTRYVLDTFNQVVRSYHSATGDAKTGNLSTVAGLGGVPGAAVSQASRDARFADPMGMALDPTGTKLYVADTFNNVVRQIDLTTHVVTVVAGKVGASGYSGDGGAATSATLSYPIGIALDSTGDLFIADSYNGVVREVLKSNGNIYTVAGTGLLGFSGDGGLATQAGLYFPYGVTVDSATPPNLLITDSFDHRIRRVAAASPLDARNKPIVAGGTDLITTVAGDGTEGFVDGPALPVGSTTSPPPQTAQFDRPWSLAMNQGGLLVADYLNNRIRQVDLGTGSVTTIAGTASAGLNNASPSPLDTPDSGPATSGELNGPRSVSLIGDTGGLLLSDSFNNRIRWAGLTQAGIQRTQVNFDSTNLSSTSLPQSVAVTSTGSGLLVMGTVGLAGDAPSQNFFLDPTSNTCINARLEAGSTCSFQVAFQPRTLGTDSSSVKIPNNAVGGAQSVALNGQATAALVTLSPPAVSIYQAPSGTSTPAVIGLSNNGTGLLEIKLIQAVDGSLAAQGRNSVYFSQANNCPQFIQPHGQCQITVTLNPLDPADRSAKIGTLIVKDDAAGNPVTTQIVPLTGSVGQPAAMMTQQDLAFAQNIGTSSAPQSFALVNSGQVPMHLFQIRDDGDFSQTNNCPPVLAPGASCAISVFFVPSTLGERDGYVVVVDDSADSPQRIAVTGVATMPAAQLGAGRLNFTANVGSATPQQIVNLVNRGDGPLTIGGIAATGDFRAAPQCPAVLLPGTSCSIAVTFVPKASGSENGSLIVNDDSNALPGSQQTVLLSGVAHEPVASLSATSLTVGVNLGGSVTRSLTVTNTGDGALTIRGIGISGRAGGDWSQSSNCVQTIQPGGSCTISISFTPHGYGAREATMVLLDDGPGGSQSIALHGSGTAPRALLSGSYLNFGGDAVGNPSAPQSILLFNAGNGPLSISSVSLTGPDYLLGTSCGPTLGAGASCRITVTFLPQGKGPRSGQVTITDSVGAQRFSLSGVGT